MNQALSKVVNTGVPQGCVSSSILFTLYTNDCTSSYPSTFIVKFSDDTAILGLMDISSYTLEVKKFVQWCEDHHLIVNTKKTEEIIFDPGHLGDHSTLLVHNGCITQVHSYKYLGVYIDCKLSRDVHVSSVCTKIQQRLYFLRRLWVFGVEQRVLMLFYQAVIESVLLYGIVA